MRADRLLILLLLLQTRGRVTAQTLAKRLEVSERTIYRDLEALSLAGVPVYAEQGPGGGWKLLEDYRLSLGTLVEVLEPAELRDSLGALKLVSQIFMRGNILISTIDSYIS